jgi:thioredoxin reductase (NADPH)
MDAPVLLVVDPDRHAREGLAGALGRRFGADYRIVASASPEEGLTLLQQCAAEVHDVALMIANLWTPGMNGIEVLARGHDLHPGAIRVLLADFGDMSAMGPLHRGMALGQIDLFVFKPSWLWAEEQLYPEIQQALSTWARAHRPQFELLRLVGEQWSARCHELRDLLTRNLVPFGFYDAASDEGMHFLRECGLDASRLPVVIRYDGKALVEPTNADVAGSLGVSTRPQPGIYDVAVVGGGPAGLAAAVYGESEGLRTVVIEHAAIGGQAGSSSMIRNYLGFPRGVSGGDLTARAFEQALNFGAEFIFANEVAGRSISGTDHVLTLADGSELRTRAVIIATGVTYRRLAIPALESLIGAGVFYGAALAEARAMAGQEVFIVGAGNSAGQAALHLAKFAERVTIVVRSESLAASMSDYLIREIETKPNIVVRVNTQVVDGTGHNRLERLHLQDRLTGHQEMVPAAALFVMIGATPRTDWVGDILRDSNGYLLTGRDITASIRPGGRSPLPLETSVPGIFAVGDVRANSVKRVASAVGDGSVSIRLVHEYLASVRSRVEAER